MRLVAGFQAAAGVWHDSWFKLEPGLLCSGLLRTEHDICRACRVYALLILDSHCRMSSYSVLVRY